MALFFRLLFWFVFSGDFEDDFCFFWFCCLFLVDSTALDEKVLEAIDDFSFGCHPARDNFGDLFLGAGNFARSFLLYFYYASGGFWCLWSNIF